MALTEQSNLIEVSLALPAYNEEANITRVLDDAVRDLERGGRSWEILVIDNCSSDKTAEKVTQYSQKDPRVKLFRHDTNRLYSGSCATAVKNMRGQYLCIMDSDGQFTAANLPKFIQRIDAGDNLVFGWRRVRHDPFFRKVITLVFNALGKISLNFPLHDLNCGIRVFDQRTQKIAEFKHRINMSNPELFVRAQNAGLKISEVEIQHFERTAGTTSHDLFKIWKIFLIVNRYFSALSNEIKKTS